MRYFFPVFLVLLAQNQTAVGGEEKEDDRQAIQGEWTAVSMWAAGTRIPEDQAKKVKISFTKDQIAIPRLSVQTEQTGVLVGKRGEKKVVLYVTKDVEKSRYELDPGKSPCEIRFMDDKGKEAPWKGIYQIDGDRMKLFTSYPDRPKDFPKDLESAKIPSSSMYLELVREPGRKN